MTHNASLVTALQLQTESQGVSRKIAGDSPTPVAARLRHALKSSESHSSIRSGGTAGGTPFVACPRRGVIPQRYRFPAGLPLVPPSPTPALPAQTAARRSFLVPHSRFRRLRSRAGHLPAPAPVGEIQYAHEGFVGAAVIVIS